MSNIIVRKNDEIIYQGNILDIPIKNDHIIKKSIEIFDDDDPCIIHKSFVIKKFVDEFLKTTNLKKVKKMDLNNFNFPFLAIDISNCTIEYSE